MPVSSSFSFSWKCPTVSVTNFCCVAIATRSFPKAAPDWPITFTLISSRRTCLNPQLRGSSGPAFSCKTSPCFLPQWLRGSFCKDRGRHFVFSQCGDGQCSFNRPSRRKVPVDGQNMSRGPEMLSDLCTQKMLFTDCCLAARPHAQALPAARHMDGACLSTHQASLMQDVTFSQEQCRIG
jgi:hypothetical protein